MPESRAQVRWAHSVLAGKAEGDEAFAREVVQKMHGKSMKSLPERAGKRRPKVRRKVHRVTRRRKS